MMTYSRLFPLLLLLAAPVLPAQGAEPFRWRDASFDAFSKGELGNSGQNLTLTADGKIRTIHRFDLNSDGYVDLFFGNTHDEQTAIPPTEFIVEPGKDGVTRRALPLFGGDKVRMADLNRDGYTDLVFTHRNDGLQSSWRHLGILYGGPEGWTARRSNQSLIGQNTLDLVIADFDGDEWPDLAILNKAYGVEVRSLPDLRIYHGGPGGFLLHKVTDRVIPNARYLATADLDGDGTADLVALSHKGHGTVLLSSRKSTDAPLTFTLDIGKAECLAIAPVSPQGDLLITSNTSQAWLLESKGDGTFKPARVLETGPASHLSVGDLDGDGHADLVLSFLQSSVAAMASTTGVADDEISRQITVLWGHDSGGRTIWSHGQALQLPVALASATAIADLKGNGRPDLLVAVFQGEHSFASTSVIFENRGERRFERSPTGLEGTGGSDIAFVPPEKALPGRIILANRVAGTLHEKVPAYVYWGAKEGFSATNRWEIPAQSAHIAIAADLDGDGFTDLITPSTAHGGVMALRNPEIGMNILWGSEKGIKDSPRAKTVLPVPWMDQCSVADVNRDGYLDLIVSGWTPWLGPEKGKPSEILIYHGSAKGISSTTEPVRIAAEGANYGLVVADFDNDGWLDIATAAFQADMIRILHGSASGFSADRQSTLAIETPGALDTADLNGDGYLDLIASRYHDKTNGRRDAGNVIFWGSPEGFREWDSQSLPGFTTVQFLVADFDQDGHLDLFAANYHDQQRRSEIPSYLFWGGREGFDPERRTPIYADSASGAFAADFNGDGKPDLAVSSHTRHGDHQINSFVLLNDGQRFASPAKTLLPTLGSHFMYRRTAGNIAHRRLEETYRSAVITPPAETAYRQATLTAEATIPSGAALDWSLRTAATPEALERAPWQPLTAGQPHPLASDARCAQYQATFRSGNGDAYPELEGVTLLFEP